METNTKREERCMSGDVEDARVLDIQRCFHGNDKRTSKESIWALQLRPTAGRSK